MILWLTWEWWKVNVIRLGLVSTNKKSKKQNCSSQIYYKVPLQHPSTNSIGRWQLHWPLFTLSRTLLLSSIFSLYFSALEPLWLTGMLPLHVFVLDLILASLLSLLWVFKQTRSFKTEVRLTNTRVKGLIFMFYKLLNTSVPLYWGRYGYIDFVF